jgi:hypothetical protein
MSRHAVNNGLRSKKQFSANKSSLSENPMPPPESKLNQLHAELIIFLPLSCDAAGMRYYWANPLWFEYLQYSLEDIKMMDHNFFATIFNENDHSIVRRLIQDLAFCGSGKIITNTFTMNSKDNTEVTALWTCTVCEWHYAGKPKYISFCGTILDKNFRDPKQLQVYLNRMAHSKKIELVKALDAEYYKLLKLAHDNTPNKEIAKLMNWSVSKVKKCKAQLVTKLEFATYADMIDFTFQSSLFY